MTNENQIPTSRLLVLESSIIFFFSSCLSLSFFLVGICSLLKCEITYSEQNCSFHVTFNGLFSIICPVAVASLWRGKHIANIQRNSSENSFSIYEESVIITNRKCWCCTMLIEYTVSAHFFLRKGSSHFPHHQHLYDSAHGRYHPVFRCHLLATCFFCIAFVVVRGEGTEQ